MGAYNPRHCSSNGSKAKPRQQLKSTNFDGGVGSKAAADVNATGGGGGGGGDGGGGIDRQQWMYKAKRHLGKSAQSVLKSLAVNVLIVSLFNFWNWLASRLNVGHYQSKSITTFCANSTSSGDTKESFHQNLLIVQEESNMTFEVSEIMTAVVNPEELVREEQEDSAGSDQEDSLERMKNHLSAASALPVLRLNSESFEDHLSSEGDLMFEEDDASSSSSSENSGIHTGRRDQDSCSDYCSGSGSLSGSPIPDHHLHHHQIDSVVVNSQLIRRDSDTSDSSVNEDDEGKSCGGGEGSPELKAKIVSQVESMFSDEHLEKDGFLLKHVRRRSDGFVSLKLVAGLRKVKQLSREFSTVLVSLKESEKLEVNAEGTKIRRKEPLTSLLKSLPIKQAKKEKSQTEKDNQNSSNGNNSSADEQQSISIIRASNQTNKENVKSGMRINNQKNGAAPTVYSNGVNGTTNRRNSNQYPNAKGPASRKNSNVSTASSNGSNSRNGSFSSGTARPHPADLFRHVMNSTSSGSSGDDSPQVVRRRGGSLPINTGHRGSIGGHNNLSPNSSPPSNVPAGFLRPKSNSYCEGTNQQTSGMSPWLLKRKASAVSRSSNGDIVISGVVRQPRGPDGTKGFASGYRELILQERLLTSVSECCTFSA